MAFSFIVFFSLFFIGKWWVTLDQCNLHCGFFQLWLQLSTSFDCWAYPEFICLQNEKRMCNARVRLHLTFVFAVTHVVFGLLSQKHYSINIRYMMHGQRDIFDFKGKHVYVLTAVVVVVGCVMHGHVKGLLNWSKYSTFLYVVECVFVYAHHPLRSNLGTVTTLT